MALTQKHRLIAVGSPLGDDVLLLRRFTGHEQLGRLFEYQLELLSSDERISFQSVLGKNMTVRVEAVNGSTRYFNGYVSQFGQIGTLGRYALYKAVLQPGLWFLTRSADCRIFQNQKVPDIVKTICREHGVTDIIDRLTRDYRQWDYCVQYRETAFNFVSRLLEQEGIYYYFKHENGKHNLVLADDYSAHETMAQYAEVAYFIPEVRVTGDEERIHQWAVSQQVQPGKYALKDFDFTAPRKDLLGQLNRPKSHAQAHFEQYDYPGEYTELSEGMTYARLRLEELQAAHETAEGTGNARGLATGYLFNLIDCPREEYNRQYLITAARYEIQSNEYESASYGGGGVNFESQLTAIPAQQPYRTPRTTPKPMIRGPQTATVVGKAGEEIWTDKYGRVKCQFHWDRYGKADENSSCWIRVAQDWAGKRWGSWQLPRIGHEVIVEFLEGDPDRPIITGSVYNGANLPPYELPAKAVISTLKSNSTKGGGGFNEIRFDDTKGREQFFVHAEYNQDIRIKNDCLEWIGHQYHLIVKDDRLELIEGDHHTTIKGDANSHIKGTQSLKIDRDCQEKVGQRHALEAGREIHLKAGQQIVLEANASITLKAGSGFIVIDAGGVTISGAMVKINSGGAAGNGSGCAPDKAKLPKEAACAESGQVTDASAAPIQPKSNNLDSSNVRAYQNPLAQALATAAQKAAAFVERCAG